MSIALVVVPRISTINAIKEHDLLKVFVKTSTVMKQKVKIY